MPYISKKIVVNSAIRKLIKFGRIEIKEIMEVVIGFEFGRSREAVSRIQLLSTKHIDFFLEIMKYLIINIPYSRDEFKSCKIINIEKIDNNFIMEVEYDFD